ncbi:peroxide stress protein YaaA [Ornithinimicrobium faecis]|uniref:Peroxide stress protein YaaA n=1 Tax=Ornithinimicrobium faecis TaxID=2934158 RepID=A0ABY4YQ81_9MICO|nr:peroxide stress protein YaaA [Ornithinimicrobium sp. HY1793]USQ78425.1 peroxide stress protein YaaA [Ornithinimicrobium sp. HY1793]
MLILLPPSESKTGRTRGRPLDLERLSLPGLTAARAALLGPVAEVSGRPAAADLLGVSPNLTEEIARNTRLTTAPSVPTADLYTGVLYDALDLASLDATARRRANRRVLVISALFGALRLTDRVPPYRLSMAVNVPGVGPLAGHWRQPLAQELPAVVGRGLVIDCRSSTYAAAWVPQGDLARRWVQIRVPGATHMAKHTRGLVTRALCQSQQDPRTPSGLAEVLAEAFRVELHQPASATKPWVLDVHTPKS